LTKTKTQTQLIALDDRFDAAKNLDAGARLLSSYIKQMHNRDLGIMAYNGGIGGVNKYCKPLVVTACNIDWMAYKYLEKIKTAMA
jgi:soluble lytic murein transglycosylase-like protein